LIMMVKRSGFGLIIKSVKLYIEIYIQKTDISWHWQWRIINNTDFKE
jgi:hypothetical protein